MPGRRGALALALALSFTACSGDSPTGGDPKPDDKPGPPAAISVSSGNGQTGPAGEALPGALVVRITDAKGRGVPNATVTFAVTTGDGSTSPASVTTDSDGTAQGSWTLGRFAGEQTATASVASLTPAGFTATATPNGTISGTVTFLDSLVSAHQVSAIHGLGRSTRRPDAGPSWIRQPTPGRHRAGLMDEGPRYVPGSLLVTLRSAPLGAAPPGHRSWRVRATAEAVSREIRERLHEHEGGTVAIRDVSPVLRTARLQVPVGREEEVRQTLLRDPDVLRVEREGLLHARRAARAAPVQPNDPAYLAQAWHYRMVNLHDAWKRGTGSANVLVAVVDDGIRFDHPDITANLTSDGYDFVSSMVEPLSGCADASVDNAGDGNGYDPDPTTPAEYSGCSLSDAGGHGLHVAGTIGAVGNNGIGLTGMNWTVKIRPVRVLGVTGSGSYYDIAQGILYAAGLPASNGAGGTVQAPSRAPIINLSLGGSADAQVLRDAVMAAGNAGSLLVAAAGNDNTSAPHYPAAYAEVLTVSAVGPDGLRASYSNFGAHVDLAAPGGDFADGDATFAIASTQWDFSRARPVYGWENGTSMAAPHVSGAAALLLAAEPSLTAAQLRARLLEWAREAGPAGVDPEYGAGILDVRSSLLQKRTITGYVHARLYDAATGAIVKEARASGTSFSLGALADGEYHVFAGMDDEGDGIFGINGYHWGGLTSDAGMTSIAVQGAGNYPASFSIGFAREREPNDAPGAATRIMLGGSLYASRPSTGDVDYYRITLPAGTYTFETVGWSGSCGFAYDDDTVLSLHRADGTLMAENDDVNESALNFCSRVTQTLDAGTYLLRLTGTGWKGLYRVIARSGS